MIHSGRNAHLSCRGIYTIETCRLKKIFHREFYFELYALRIINISYHGTYALIKNGRIEKTNSLASTSDLFYR